VGRHNIPAREPRCFAVGLPCSCRERSSSQHPAAAVVPCRPNRRAVLVRIEPRSIPRPNLFNATALRLQMTVKTADAPQSAVVGCRARHPPPPVNIKPRCSVKCRPTKRIGCGTVLVLASRQTLRCQTAVDYARFLCLLYAAIVLPAASSHQSMIYDSALRDKRRTDDPALDGAALDPAVPTGS
jgi:hypothetical protein